jgi:prolyl oligopeptidase
MSNLPAPARIEDVVDEHFGVRVPDPYRWLERQDDEGTRWVRTQGAYATEVLAGLPDRDALLARVAELNARDTRSGFAVAGDRVFFTEHAARADQGVLMVRDGSDERVLLDLATLAGESHASLDWYEPGPGGDLVACGISAGGSENSALHILDVATGELGPELATGLSLGVLSWLPDGGGVVYHHYPPPAPGTPPAERRRDSETVLLRLGQSIVETVLRRGLNPALLVAPRDRPLLVLTPGSDWMLAVVSHESLGHGLRDKVSACTFHVAPLSTLDEPATVPWRQIAGPADEVSAFTVDGDTLYLVSSRDAPRSRLLAVSMATGDAAGGTVLVPPSGRALQSTRLAGDDLLIRYVDGAPHRLLRLPLAGGEPTEVPLPVQGTIEQWCELPGGDVLLVLSSWTEPPRAYRYDIARGTVEPTDWMPDSPAELIKLVVTETEYPARDGTLIPLSIVHRPGLPLDGDNPTLVDAYGSYGLCMTPEYRPALLAWCERGGVYAVAHVRGGGAHGREWHAAGKLLNKENTIIDFIDCAEHLVGAGYTRPGRIGGIGASAGGIPTGGAVVRRPDLFAAMVIRVPVCNAVRAEHSENGPINTPEFGSVTTEEGLRALLIIDSYARVVEGAAYPAVLLTAGMNDRRVAVWQPGKLAARLQAATASGKPVLLRVDEHAGHGFGNTQRQRDLETADSYAFLLAAFDH